MSDVITETTSKPGAEIKKASRRQRKAIASFKASKLIKSYRETVQAKKELRKMRRDEKNPPKEQ